MNITWVLILFTLLYEPFEVLIRINAQESLHCPDESKCNTQGTGYKTIAGLLKGFSTAGCLPKTI